jgi:hypothetical protein
MGIAKIIKMNCAPNIEQWPRMISERGDRGFLNVAPFIDFLLKRFAVPKLVVALCQNLASRLALSIYLFSVR